MMHAKDVVRVTTVQYELRGVSGTEEFKSRCSYFVEVAADRGSDFVLFPELFTTELLSSEKRMLSKNDALQRLTELEGELQEFWAKQAKDHNINIISGSTVVLDEKKEAVNKSAVYLRDGQAFEQLKIHPTPNEAENWSLKGGNEVNVIQTDCGPVGVLICYDSEFPELARHLADQGAMLLFVPFCTDDRRGFLRVRYCCHARAVENQMYVVTSGVVGNLANVHNMDTNYAESAILTPCDYAFDRDGIAAELPPNVEMAATADLRLTDLTNARKQGSVRNLADRRSDLYHVNWLGDGGEDRK